MSKYFCSEAANQAATKAVQVYGAAGLMEGTGRFMRHVKLRPGEDVDAAALQELIARAYVGMRSLLAAARAGRHA